MFKKYRYQIVLTLITLISSLLFWFIFYFNIPGQIGFPDVTLETVFANYDGPNYLVISKCGYDKACIGPTFSLSLPHEYYPAHFPGYPLIIKFFDIFTTGPKSMLFSTLLGSVFLSLVSFSFFKLFIKENKAFLLSLFLIFLPARLFVLRQVGAPETLFLATIIASLYYFKKNKYLVSAIFAALAQTLKSPAILLTASYAVYALYLLFSKKESFPTLLKKYSVYLLTPLTILAIFYLYQLQTGNFWAYFSSGDNFHLNALPYTVFISNKSWIGSIWLEDILYIYFFAIYAVYKLFKKRGVSPLTIFTLIFTVATLFVAHRDISRYIAPVYPFILLAFHKKLTKKKAFFVLILLIPAIYLYAINFVIGNTAPIADWTPYL